MRSLDNEPGTPQPLPGAAGPEAADDDAWNDRLRDALGDDDALLGLLRGPAPPSVKQAAVAELRAEAALRAAERALRDQDRSVHRLAKQRYDQALARRHARAQADALVTEARALASESVVTRERLVDIDRRWQALDTRLVDAAQRDDYAALMAELDALSHRSAPPAPAPTESAPAAIAPPPPHASPAPAQPSGATRRARSEPSGLEPGAEVGPAVALDPRLEAALGAVQAALDEGQLALATQHLAALRRLAEVDATPSEALRERLDGMQAEIARLAAWRQWSGNRARDELLQEAEALAAATVGEAPDPKLPLKRRAEVIDALRARWKALDRQGANAPRSLWQRFDAALATAYRPLAEHVAAQRAAREHNQAARERLLDALEGLSPPADGSPIDEWRALAVAVERFHGDWRRLGPLEHSVAPAARKPLAARMAAALQRLEAPLQSQRQAARQARERLLQAARALAGDLQGRDWLPRVRELQAEWQRQARSLPLARTDEQALWNEFRTTIDGAFAARDAAFKAREAEQQALWQQRADVVVRLESLPEDLNAAQIRHAMAEAEAQWQRLPPMPRGVAGEGQARFERARERARRRLGDLARQSWLATCDALKAKLALCESLEAGVDAPAPEAGAPEDPWRRWPVLPEPLEQALAGRAGRGAPLAPLPTPTDELLLVLEDRWGLPTPPAFAEARQALKLLRLKATLESRRPAAPPAPPGVQLGALLARTRLEAPQRERLHALLDELRRRGPDALAPH